MRDSQAKDELEVFHAFAEVAAPNVDMATLQAGQRREPDILCVDSIEGPRALELVELLDNNYARRRGHRGTRSAIETCFEKLPDENKAAFEKRFGNAHLNFCFVNCLTNKQREKIIPRIFEKLTTLPEGFTGCALDDDPELAGVLERVSVSRGPYQGPIFVLASGGWVGEPAVPYIACKFGKRYEAACAVELLAYIDGNPMGPDVVWLGDLIK